MQLTEQEKSEIEENWQQSYSSFSLVIDTIYLYSQTCLWSKERVAMFIDGKFWWPVLSYNTAGKKPELICAVSVSSKAQVKYQKIDEMLKTLATKNYFLFQIFWIFSCICKNKAILLVLAKKVNNFFGKTELQSV